MNSTFASSWQHVAGLSLSQQRALLHSADPSERIWASWALALQLGGAAVAEVRTRPHDEPTPGVRRQLVVVLAGLGETDLVHQMALHDPDAGVRGTAVQYFIRTLDPGSAAAEEFAARRIEEDVVRVRLAILEEVLAGRVALPESLLLKMVVGQDRDQRSSALEALGRRGSLASPTVMAMIEHLPHEGDADLRGSFISLIIREGSELPLLRRAASFPEETSLAVLTIAAGLGVHAGWQDLEALARRPEIKVQSAVLEFLTLPLEAEVLTWLASVALNLIAAAEAQGAQARRADELVLQRKVLGLLWGALGSGNNELLHPRVAKMVRRFGAETKASWEWDRYD